MPGPPVVLGCKLPLAACSLPPPANVSVGLRQHKASVHVQDKISDRQADRQPARQADILASCLPRH